jgi:hypothetical protein
MQVITSEPLKIFRGDGTVWHRIQISGLHRVHIFLFIPEAKRGTMWYLRPAQRFQRMGDDGNSMEFQCIYEVMGKF